LFTFVDRHKRLLQFVLALIIVPPFAFWGIQWTQRDATGAGNVASVGGQKISEQEFADALRRQQDQLRSTLGRNFDPSMLDSPAMRVELLESMVSQRLLEQYGARGNLTISKEQIDEVIASIPAFQENGRYSSERAKAMLRAEGYSEESFIASLRRDLIVQQLSAALADSGLASKADALQIARLRAQQREVAEYQVRAEPQQAQISADSVRAYYESNSARFQVPEQVRVEFLVLDVDALLASETVSAEEVKASYEANTSRYGEPEQRRASHILIGFKSGAGDAEKAKARERASAILSQLRKAPDTFAELAKKNSDDPGSASKGGDLDYFSRGMMVGPFEDAAFRLKLNEISGLVESDFGFHIIKLTGIKPGKMKSLEQVRPEIERELKKQKAVRRFAETAETFSNLVYEQADSLKPAAERFKLAIRNADGVTRQAASAAALNSPKLLAALFTDDAIKNRRNTEAIETAPSTLVSARVVDHKPASLRPLDEVKGEISRILARREALALARKRGADHLEELKKGSASGAGFGAPKLVSRDNPRGMDAEALSQVFRADASKLPAYVGTNSENGYVIYRVSRVVDVEPDEAGRREVQAELGKSSGMQEFKSFLGSLRADAKVEIDSAALEKKTP
jgi:peptidyl-prolyl cis-trans isomerase D